MDRASWIRLWNADIPPKLKVFVWQIFNRALPTSEALIAKKVPVHPRCPVCWESAETMEHLFLDCPVARALWGFSGMEHLGEGLPRQTFPLFLKRLLGLIQSPGLFMAIVCLLWRIWRSRNWVVFEGKQFGFPALMRQFHQQYEEWVSLSPAVGARQARSPRVSVGGDSRVVCMWDGATKLGSHSAGGMVLMTPARGIMLVKGYQLQGIDDPMVVELLVLREAIVWCLELGVVDVRLEGDAKVLIDKINRADARSNRVGAVLEEIMYYVNAHPGLDIRFVGRRNNRVAHLVARKALSLYPAMSRYFDFRAWLSSRM
ncbi:unnamed protein product [Linum trigynum]|uniref:Reverse transcriptase zinc-binding domain-containing protein n=1 Tax=Linum trigynum TaxID=586398 RepID=A0AAV2DMV7_9ROSI